MSFKIRRWHAEEFASSEHLWQNLLARSSADPLFNSWSWMYGWWQHHHRKLKACLHIVAVYRNDELVGIAPMYWRRVMHRGVVPAWRMEMLGTAWRDLSTVFSEYADIIADRECVNEVIDALASNLITEKGWMDFVVPNTDVNSLLATLVRDRLQEECYVREMDPMTAHVAKLPKRFDQYVQGLDPGVRRKMWNHRARLVSPELRVRSGNVEEFLDEMNALHEKRWGQRHYEGVPRQFHLQFTRAAAKDKQLRLTELWVDDKVVSLMYNIRIGHREYNLQSAFDDSRVPHVSLGYLHLGYAMESAGKEGVTEFDLLGGRGKNRDYKNDFETTPTQMVCFQAIRSRTLAWLYKKYDSRYATVVGLGVSWIASFVDDQRTFFMLATAL